MTIVDNLSNTTHTGTLATTVVVREKRRKRGDVIECGWYLIGSLVIIQPG